MTTGGGTGPRVSCRSGINWNRAAGDLLYGSVTFSNFHFYDLSLSFMVAITSFSIKLFPVTIGRAALRKRSYTPKRREYFRYISKRKTGNRGIKHTKKSTC